MWRFRERRPADEFLRSLIVRLPFDDLQQVANFLGLDLRRMAFSERAGHVATRVVARADDVALVLKLLNFFYFWSNTMPRGGRVIATGITRLSAVDELDGEGSDYQAAMTALRASVPGGSRILSVRSVE